MVVARRTRYSYLGRCAALCVLGGRNVVSVEVMELNHVLVPSMDMCQQPADVLTRTKGVQRVARARRLWRPVVLEVLWRSTCRPEAVDAATVFVHSFGVTVMVDVEVVTQLRV